MTHRIASGGVGALVGLVFGGWVGLLVGAAIGVAVLTHRGSVLVTAAAAPWVLAVMTLVEASSSARDVARFAALRPLSHDAGIVAALLWMAMGLALVLDRAADEAGDPGVASAAPSRPPVWLLAALLSVAVLGTLVMID